MDAPYIGPLRDEPLAVELHNTVYAAGGRLVDGLEEPASAEAFIQALAARLPCDLPPGSSPTAAQLIALREVVRPALHATIERAPHDADTLAAISEVSSLVPTSPAVALARAGEPERVTDYHGASRSGIVLAAFARSAIELVAGPSRANIRACAAPGCVLLYLKAHPRRQWCCNACGNRARQARHYRRVRGG